MPDDAVKQFHIDLGNAFAFAARLHAAQVRKGTRTPYVSHLLGVASLVLESGGDRDQAIAALLHDSLEDQAEHYPGGAQALKAAIAAEFGPAVLEMVVGCTNPSVSKDPREKKEDYVRHLRHLPEAIRLVSCADKVHNARSILFDLRQRGCSLWERFNGGREVTLAYYRALANEFLRPGRFPLAEELERTVSEIERVSRDGARA